MYSTDALSGILCCWKASEVSLNHCKSSELWNPVKGTPAAPQSTKGPSCPHHRKDLQKESNKEICSLIPYQQLLADPTEFWESNKEVLFLDTRQNNSLLQQLQNCTTASGKTGHDCRSKKNPKNMTTTHPICYLQTCHQIIFNQENASLCDQATEFS